MKSLLLLILNASPVFAGLFVLVGQLGCQFKSEDVAQKPVIQVNSRQMSVKEYSELLARRLSQFDALGAKDKANIARIKEDLFQACIVQAITSEWAAKNGLGISDEELDAEVNKVRQVYPDDLSFRRLLAQENISFNSWKEGLRQSLLEKKVLSKAAQDLKPPKEEETRAYYLANKDRWKRKERILLRQIVLDQEITAEKVLEELVKKKDFEGMAKKFSVAPEGKNGGLIGWVEKGVVDIFDKAFALPVGTISKVLESPYGFHIFKVEKKASPGILAYEEVLPQIKTQVMRQKEQFAFTAWLESQIRAARILRDNTLLNSLTVETRSSK